MVKIKSFKKFSLNIDPEHLILPDHQYNIVGRGFP